MSDAAHAIETARLTVRTHLDAEVFLIASDRRMLARGVGRLETHQPKGLYKIKATRAMAIVEQLVDLDKDTSLSITVPGLDTVVPFASALDGASRGAMEGLFREASGALGGTTPSVVLFERVQAKTGASATQPLSEVRPVLFGLRVIPWETKEAVELPEPRAREVGADRCAADALALPPGNYVLETNDGVRVRRQALLVLPSWETRVFLRRSPAPRRPGQKVEGPQADLVDVAVHFSRGGRPIALEPEFEPAEVARLALAMGRRIVSSPEIINLFLDEKFADPLAGVAAAHLMLDALERDATEVASKDMGPKLDLAIGPDDVARIVANLEHLLAMPQGVSADLVALKLRARLPIAPPERKISVPPVYAASWAALIKAAVGETPSIEIALGVFTRCAQSHAEGAYLAWTSGYAQILGFVEQIIKANRRWFETDEPQQGSFSDRLKKKLGSGETSAQGEGLGGALVAAGRWSALAAEMLISLLPLRSKSTAGPVDELSNILAALTDDTKRNELADQFGIPRVMLRSLLGSLTEKIESRISEISERRAN